MNLTRRGTTVYNRYSTGGGEKWLNLELLPLSLSLSLFLSPPHSTFAPPSHSLAISSLTNVSSDCVKLSIHLSITLVGVKSSSHTKSIFSAYRWSKYTCTCTCTCKCTNVWANLKDLYSVSTAFLYCIHIHNNSYCTHCTCNFQTFSISQYLIPFTELWKTIFNFWQRS